MPLTQLRSILTLNTLRGLLPIQQGQPLVSADLDYATNLAQIEQQFEKGDFLVIKSGRGMGNVVRFSGNLVREPELGLQVETVDGCKPIVTAERLRMPHFFVAAAARYHLEHRLRGWQKRRCAPHS